MKSIAFNRDISNAKNSKEKKNEFISIRWRLSMGHNIHTYNTLNRNNSINNRICQKQERTDKG